jgi:ArsR family metal-binding transcriptional regulator
MKKEDLNLRVIDFGDTDEDHTVHGAIYHPIDLSAIEKAGREISAKVILMRCMSIVFITLNEVTIHIHGNGEIVVNGVNSIEEAENILLRLFADG